MPGLRQGVGAESQHERTRPRQDHVPSVQERPHGAVDLRHLGKDEPKKLIAELRPGRPVVNLPKKVVRLGVHSGGTSRTLVNERQFAYCTPARCSKQAVTIPLHRYGPAGSCGKMSTDCSGWRS